MANILDDIAGMFEQSADYTPKHLPASQIMQESGGKQLDKQGKPLTSKAGAVGIAQVMPKTGPEAAALAGLPWDEQRYRYDSDYNLALGDAYQGMLNERFKSTPGAAKAAYNAGPTRVEKLIAQHGPNWRAHLPAETQEYIGMSGSRVPQKGDVRSIEMPASQYGNQSAGDPVSRATPVANADEMAPKVKTQADEVQRRAGGVMDILDQAQQGIRAELVTQESLTRETIAAKQVIRDEQVALAENVKTQMFPLFARKQAILDRKNELAQMDPFSKAIAGIFNPNYNQSYLNQQDNLTQEQIDLNLEQMKAMDQVQNRLTDAYNQKYTDDMTLSGLVAKNLSMNIGMANDAVQVAQAQLNSTLGALSANGEVVQAAVMQRQQVLTQLMNPADINPLLAQANQSQDGTVSVAGVKISKSDLLNRGLAIEAMQAEFRQRQLAIAAGDIQLQEMSEERIIKNMTPVERQNAAAANGMYNGQQLSPKILNDYIAQDGELAKGVVNQVVVNEIGAQTKQLATQYARVTQQQSARVQSVFGPQATPELSRMQITASEQIMEKKRILDAMPEGPAKQTVQAQLAQQLAQNQQAFETKVEEIIKRSTSDPEVQGLYRSWITNQPISGDAAVRGFVNMTRSGALVPGMSKNDPAYPAIQAMRGAVNEVYKRNGGQQNFELKRANKQTKAEMEYQLMQAVSGAATKNFTGKVMGDMLLAAPSMAKADGYRAGEVSPGLIKKAQDDGDKRGLQLTASNFGLEPDAVAQLAQAPLDSLTPEQKKIRSALAANQGAEMVRSLDAGWVAGRSPRPSALLAEYLASPAFQAKMSNYDQNIGANSMGTMLVSAIAGKGAIANQASAWGKNFGAAVAAVDQADAEEALSVYRNYNRDPFKRVGAILGSFEQLDQGSEQRVLEYIKANVDPAGPGRGLTRIGSGYNDQVAEAYYGPKIEEFVLHGEWAPEMKQFQKVVQKEWTARSRMIDSAVGRLK